MTIIQGEFVGYVFDRMGDLPTRKTRKYSTYKEAYVAAQKLAKKYFTRDRYSLSVSLHEIPDHLQPYGAPDSGRIVIENIRLSNGDEIELIKATEYTEGKGWYLWNHHRQQRAGTFKTLKDAVDAMEQMK